MGDVNNNQNQDLDSDNVNQSDLMNFVNEDF